MVSELGRAVGGEGVAAPPIWVTPPGRKNGRGSLSREEREDDREGVCPCLAHRRCR